MSKIDSRAVEDYQKLLESDPKSKAFAALAEAYRGLGMRDQAETLLRRGISFHPKYAPGYVVLARINLERKNFEHAIRLLAQAIEISPDNLLAHQLLGEAYLQMKNPKEALRAHKMALFLNPQSTRSQQVVKKLESLSAEEFEDDIFEMRPLKPHSVDKTLEKEYPLDRSLSFIDALIVRHQMPLAKQKLNELQNRFPGNPEVQSRWNLISNEDQEQAESIKPLASREKQILDYKIEKLQKVLAALSQRAELEP